MRILNAAVGAALLILVASPALAGDPRGGGHGGGGGHPGGGCGGGCGGGGHRPPPPHGGGGNINVNVNANASASAFAGASAGGYFNARAYDMGGFRGGGYGGGTTYVGGGYGGDMGGYYGGGAVYNEEVYEGRTCASAPFGYVVAGFGRSERRAPACVATRVCRDADDRGGRYGYSERHSCGGGGGRREAYGSYEESSYEESSYESRESWQEYEGYSGGYEEVDYDSGGYARTGGGLYSGGHGCDCDHGGRDNAPYPPPYVSDPPYYNAPDPAPPRRPRPSRPTHQRYSQEPGERG